MSAWDEIFVGRIYDIGEVGTRPLLIDLGANIGLAALYWKWRYGDIRYIGFEPDAQIAAICRANLATWNVGGELHQAAVTGHVGDVDFVSDGADGGRISTGAPTSRARVPGVSLRPYLSEAVDCLKIDIEGAESDVLRDIADLLGRVKAIFVEAHLRPEEPQRLPTVLSILEQVGFRCHVQVGFDSPRPLSLPLRSPTGYESLVNVFGVREPRTVR